MADAVVSLLLEKLVTYLVDEGRQLLEFKDKFDEIKKEFQYMQSFVEDADRVKRRDRTKTLNLIMNDVRELIYDAEEIITDCQLLSQKKKQGRASSSFSPTLLKSRYLLGKELKDIDKRIKQVKQNMISYLAKIPVHGRKEITKNIPLTHPILMTEDSIVGLEDESKKITNLLLAENHYLNLVGIVGMGGIGKTTLAQKIFKSEIIETTFKHLTFVTVSQSFRFDEILKKMLKKLDVTDELLHANGEDDLLEILKNTLDDKYLIILDDVWEVDAGQWWESLSSALPKDKGGCVMVTTRNEELARYMGATNEHIHHANTLSKENSWLLFCKVAFAMNGGISPIVELEKYGKEIVARCGGLPLTIKIVGGMMMGKDNSISEWERISKHLKEEMTGNRKDELVMSRLELSYEELHMHLRPCLLCFAMYAEDTFVPAYEIIKIWTSEGFIWGRNGKTASEIGDECLNELRNRCLLLKDEEGQFGSVFSFYHVHDAVREMLMKIATEESFFSMKPKDGPMTSISRRVVTSGDIAPESIENEDAKLRMLAVFNAESKNVNPVLETNLQRLRRLRTLHLQLSPAITNFESVSSMKWLKGIGSLHHLTYLHLDGVDALRTLPDSISGLGNLQFLRISNCPNLKSLPASITMLGNLIAFNLFGVPSIKCLPKGLGKLSNLEQLMCVNSVDGDVPNSWISLSELKQLKKLRLLVMKISEEQCNVLQTPESLQNLCLYFPDVSSPGAVGITRKIDCQLSHPLQCLKELFLCYYPGESIPAWLSPTSLPSLHYLCIRGGSTKNLGEGFFAGGGAWKVETLVLEWLEELEEDWENIEKVMPSLRFAHVKKCPKLKYSEEAFQPSSHNWITWKKHIRGESCSSLVED